MPNILFVCTANRFRSPIAAAAFRKELTARDPAADWHVSSAGTWTTEGLPAVPDAIRGARRLGLDIADHASRPITRQLIHEADVIIVMEHGHKEALCSEFRDCAHKVHTLGQTAAGIDYDVPDPTSPSTANEIPAEIDDLIHRGFDQIRALAHQK